MLGELRNYHEQPAQTPEGNFKHWKSVVGLPDSFPKLSPIEDNPDGFHAGNVHKAVIGEILQTGSPLRVAVIRGQGCTTLSRYVHHALEEQSLSARTIPIFMHVDYDRGEPMHYNEELSGRIRYGIAHLLATQPVWNQVGKHEYANALGGRDGRQCEELQKNLNGIVQHHRLMNPDQDGYISRDQVGGFFPIHLNPFPILEDPLHHPLFKYLQKRGFGLKFVFDLSPRFSENYDPEVYAGYSKLASSMKKKLEEFQKQNSELRVDEIYFSDPYTLKKIFPGDQRVGWDIEYPPYSPADVFAILAKQYRPEAGHLATVIDPQLLERLVKPDRPLAEIIDEFGRDLKQRMQSFDSLPYRIHS